MNIEKNAIYILENIGGKENVNQVSHCATRLRFQVKNKDLIKKDIIENLEGIFGVHIIGNECQIIVGGDIIKYYPIIQSKIDKTENITVSKKKNSLKDYGFAFLDFVSGNNDSINSCFDWLFNDSWASHLIKPIWIDEC